MLNPDPEKFYPLSEAFNVLGRSRFGDKWTGAELAARDLPPPKHTFQALKDAVEARARAHQECDRERREKIKRAKKAASAVKSGPSISRRPRSPVQPAAPEAVERRRIEEIAKIAGLEPETVKAVNDQRAYRKE